MRQHRLSMKRAGFFKRIGSLKLPPAAPHRRWRKEAWINDEMHPKSLYPQGVLADVTPRPGHTYTRDTWPPRGRGRGQSLTSPRRIEAKLRAQRVIQLRMQGMTWDTIARIEGFKDRSGPFRAVQRAFSHLDNDRARSEYYQRYATGRQ